MPLDDMSGKCIIPRNTVDLSLVGILQFGFIFILKDVIPPISGNSGFSDLKVDPLGFCLLQPWSVVDPWQSSCPGWGVRGAVALPILTPWVPLTWAHCQAGTWMAHGLLLRA